MDATRVGDDGPTTRVAEQVVHVVGGEQRVGHAEHGAVLEHAEPALDELDAVEEQHEHAILDVDPAFGQRVTSLVGPLLHVRVGPGVVTDRDGNTVTATLLDACVEIVMREVEALGKGRELRHARSLPPSPPHPPGPRR